jgi:hypothetical protein
VRNEYRIVDDKVYIELTSQGKTIETVVSLSKLNKLLEFDVRWYGTIHSSGNVYIRAKQYLGRQNGKQRQKTIYLHRFLTGAPEDMVVDHSLIGNTLDNTDENLRVVNQLENVQNQHKLRTDNSSGIRGVHLDAHSGKWRALIGRNGKQFSLGYFTNKDDAIKVRKEAEKKYFPYLLEIGKVI